MTKEETIKFMSTYLKDAQDIKEVEGTNTFFLERYNKGANELKIYIIKDDKFHGIRIAPLLYPTFYAERYVKAIGKFICVFDMDVSTYEFWGKEVQIDLSYIIDTSVCFENMAAEQVNGAIHDYEYFEWNSFSESWLDRVIGEIKDKISINSSVKNIVELLSTAFKEE